MITSIETDSSIQASLQGITEVLSIRIAIARSMFGDFFNHHPQLRGNGGNAFQIKTIATASFAIKI
jgi:hypothetical protein